jgi:hypothetical protein
VLLDVLPEVHQITIDVVIDFCVSAFAGYLPIFLLRTLAEQYPTGTPKHFTINVMLRDER